MRALTVTSAQESRSDDPIHTFDDLLAPFYAATKPERAWRIGPEAEKFGVDARTGAPIAYAGERGVVRILQELADRYGWTPEREVGGGPVIALRRGEDSVTLEPGGQLELSGAAVADLHQVWAGLTAHMAELGPISEQLGIRWLGVGFHPFARRGDLSWVPKMRYAVMREYLPTRGGLALDMMLRTCTVQVNLDYASEQDAMRKMRLALKLAPLTTALFANSPFHEGRLAGGVTFRGKVWLDVDPDRSGLVPTVWSKQAGFAQYVDWALDVPMFMIKRGDQKVVNTGQTFRSFWKNGFHGHTPTQSDWQMHLNTLFPEVRLKKTIEIRGADMQGAGLLCALPALWTGLLYESRALDEAEALVDGWHYDEVAHLRQQVWRDGVRAPFRGRPLADFGARLVAIAEGGLERRARRDADGRDERVHLGTLRTLVEAARTPADVLVDAVAGASDLRSALLERTDLTRS